MRSLRLCAAVVLVTVWACSAEPPKDQPGWTAQQLYDLYAHIPGDVIQKKRLTSAEAEKVREDKAVKKTEEFRHKDMPDDAGSLRFYYDPAKGVYWVRRVNAMNPSDPDWTAGPFNLPVM